MIGQARWVVPVAEAEPTDVATLGGKGASLAVLRRAGISVPPAFIVSTELCRWFTADETVPDGAWREIASGVAELEATVGRGFGDPEGPLLVSVRSGAPVSMPGMMDTILNVGLCDATVVGLERMTADDRFAWDSYVRLLHMFGGSVRGLSPAKLAQTRVGCGDAGSHEGPVALARRYRDLLASESGRPFPQDPWDQLREAVEAVLRSWESRRARRYRRHAGIRDDLGTAVVVQAMVYGNLDARSGSGVAFTRDPAVGTPELYGDFLLGAQGEDVVGGERDVGSLADCARELPDAYAELAAAAGTLEAQYRDMCDIEFTVERGRLWVLQVRVGQRTALAEVRIALDLLAEGAISAEEALDRIAPASLIAAAARVLEPAARRDLLGRGIAASPGAAVGALALSSPAAEELAAMGEPAILAREVTSPDDIGGFLAARGVVTARGGRASHAAVVARGMNRPAICGVAGMAVDESGVTFGERRVAEGEPLSIDGGTGEVFAGSLPLVAPEEHPETARLLAECDARRRIPVLALEAASWADGVFEWRGAVECESAGDVAAALAARAGRLLLRLGGDEDPAATLAAAGGAISGAGDGAALPQVFVAVDPSWPVSVRRLPAGRWAGVVAEAGVGPAARLLAATLGRSVS